MTREEADFIGGMNMCDEISNEAYKKIMCHCEVQEACEDCISRQAAINDLQGRDPSQIWDTADIEVWVNSLPPVTPQQKTGRWINNQNGTFECSECGTKHSKSNYCHNCGAKMQGVEE